MSKWQVCFLVALTDRRCPSAITVCSNFTLTTIRSRWQTDLEGDSAKALLSSKTDQGPEPRVGGTLPTHEEGTTQSSGRGFWYWFHM